MNPAPVLRLTDGITLDHVAELARSNDAPTLYSVTATSSTNPEPRAIVGTRDQLIALRNLIDHALGTTPIPLPHAGWGINRNGVSR